MEILFLSKKTDWCNKAKDYVKQNFDNVQTYQGNFGEKLPVECKDWQGEYIISYLSPWIVPEHLLLKAKKKAINFHPGTPQYGGIGCYNFAIYNEEKEYGVLCHEMTKKVDSGSIIKIRTFPLANNETVASLKKKSMKNLLLLFYEIVDMINDEKKLPASNQKWKRKPYTRKELQSLCRITLDMSEKEIVKRIRATYYPNGLDYPYLETSGKKIILKEIAIDEMENTLV